MGGKLKEKVRKKSLIDVFHFRDLRLSQAIIVMDYVTQIQLFQIFIRGVLCKSNCTLNPFLNMDTQVVLLQSILRCMMSLIDISCRRWLWWQSYFCVDGDLGGRGECCGGAKLWWLLLFGLQIVCYFYKWWIKYELGLIINGST